jgi:2-polyprenyl-3-methyl-5-hydroxy-6-metoxy-1,4-benzoquinol methylase
LATIYRDGALTDEAFWDRVWGDVQMPALIDEKVRWQLALARLFKRVLSVDPTLSVFEVGCAPGRWLVWFNKNFGYTACGCDLSRRAAETARRNLEMCDVPGKVYTADITTGRDVPEHLFDVVVSIGVIEHFADPETVVRRHLDLLKPEGTLILEVPNMAGWVNHRLLSSAGMQSLLDVHNLSTMSPAVFRSWAETFDLEVCCLEYVGGFDPGLVVYNHSYRSRWKRPVIFYALWLMEKVTRRLPWLFVNVNHHSFSNMLVGVFRRR